MIKIKDYENYVITEDGVIIRNGKPLRFGDNNGYKTIQLSKNGDIKIFYVHRLVAQAFIPNPDNKPQVNHLDGDRANNAKYNLEWCTCQENHQHRLGGTFKYQQDVSVHDIYIKSVYKTKTRREISIDIDVPEDTLSAYMDRKGWFLFKGYRWEEDRRKYRVSLMVNGKRIIKRTNTEEEAQQLYITLKNNGKSITTDE